MQRYIDKRLGDEVFTGDIKPEKKFCDNLVSLEEYLSELKTIAARMIHSKSDFKVSPKKKEEYQFKHLDKIVEVNNPIDTYVKRIPKIPRNGYSFLDIRAVAARCYLQGVLSVSKIPSDQWDEFVIKAISDADKTYFEWEDYSLISQYAVLI